MLDSSVMARCCGCVSTSLPKRDPCDVPFMGTDERQRSGSAAAAASPPLQTQNERTCLREKGGCVTEKNTPAKRERGRVRDGHGVETK